MNEDKLEYEYCAVNALGYAYGKTPREACDRLLEGTVGKGGEHPGGLIREFRFIDGCRPDRWSFYCPQWDGDRCEGVEYALLRDNMKDWPEDTRWPITMEV